MSDLDKKQKILMSIVYVLMVLSCAVIFFVIYNIIQKEKPQTLGTVYAGTLTCTDEDINIIEVKIHSNENNNGQPCYEVMFNGYTDYLGNAIKGYGMQSDTLENYSAIETISTTSGELVYNYLGGITLYNSDDYGVSSYVVSTMPKELYFDIEGKFYKLRFEY